MLLLGWDGLQQPCVRLWQALLGLLQRMLHVSVNASDTTNTPKTSTLKSSFKFRIMVVAQSHFKWLWKWL